MKPKIIIFLLLTLCVVITAGQPLLTGESDTSVNEITRPVHQLRIYEIPKENRHFFNERFKDHAHRIMKKYGFKIVAIWESESEDKLEFVYLLEWKDERTMKNAWDNFMSDQEWKDIKSVTGRQHGTYVNNIEEKTLILTDYSPQSVLFKPKH